MKLCDVVISSWKFKIPSSLWLPYLLCWYYWSSPIRIFVDSAPWNWPQVLNVFGTVHYDHHAAEFLSLRGLPTAVYGVFTVAVCVEGRQRARQCGGAFYGGTWEFMPAANSAL